MERELSRVEDATALETPTETKRADEEPTTKRFARCLGMAVKGWAAFASIVTVALVVVQLWYLVRPATNIKVVAAPSARQVASGPPSVPKVIFGNWQSTFAPGSRQGLRIGTAAVVVGTVGSTTGAPILSAEATVDVIVSVWSVGTKAAKDVDVRLDQVGPPLEPLQSVLFNGNYPNGYAYPGDPLVGPGVGIGDYDHGINAYVRERFRLRFSGTEPCGFYTIALDAVVWAKGLGPVVSPVTFQVYASC